VISSRRPAGNALSAISRISATFAKDKIGFPLWRGPVIFCEKLWKIII